MAALGESYQAALAKVVAKTSRGMPSLLRASYFGVPVTLAVYELFSSASLILVSGCGGPLSLPLAKASPLHLHAGELS